MGGREPDVRCYRWWEMAGPGICRSWSVTQFGIRHPQVRRAPECALHVDRLRRGARDLLGGSPGALPGGPRGPHQHRQARPPRASRAAPRLRAVHHRLVVEDFATANGTSPPSTGEHGYGLTGMRERAELLGGTLTTETTSGGFRVELDVPV
ncbi:MAG: hypothetical protein ACYDEY_10970 [Acidimicrobiales bacterium]